MMQVILQSDHDELSISTLSIDSFNISSCEVKLKYISLLNNNNLSIDDIIFINNGVIVENSDVIYNNDYIHVINRSLCTVNGGKGGFGKMLKAKAKQKGNKQTVDFGSCRDLEGKRLRHKNNEIILQKWQESKEANKPFDADEETPTGIDNWYLAKPSWADNIKNNRKLKQFQKNKHKSMLCDDWKRAREKENPPPNSPTYWGCPRGANCKFAHGIEELNPNSIDENDNHINKKVKVDENKEKYVNSSIVENDDDNLHSIILQGIKKEQELSKFEVKSADKEIEELPLDDYCF